MMRSVVTLLAAIALSACNPSADLAGSNNSATEQAAQSVSENSLLPPEIAGSWWFAEEGPIADSFSTVVFEGEMMDLGAAPDGLREAIGFPLSKLSDNMYKIEWGSQDAYFGTEPGNFGMICGAGGANYPSFVRLRLEGGDLVTEFHKIDQSSGEGKGFFDPWPEPCLTLRWER